MPEDLNIPNDVQRGLAADSRDHRRLLLDEWRLNVRAMEDTALKLKSLGAEYAQIGLKSAFLANAGALVALPPLMQWLPAVERAAIPRSAWWFVAGFLSAALCSLVTYVNFMINAEVSDALARTSAMELRVNYGLQGKEILSGEAYKNDVAKRTNLSRYAWPTTYIAIILAIVSYGLFFIGAFVFQNLVIR